VGERSIEDSGSFKNRPDFIFLLKLTLSDGSIAPNSLKTLNGRFGGCLNGSEPKLKRHCWKLMKDAAGKKPVLRKGIFENYAI
jgi:hypothetical protein